MGRRDESAMSERDMRAIREIAAEWVVSSMQRSHLKDTAETCLILSRMR